MYIKTTPIPFFHLQNKQNPTWLAVPPVGESMKRQARTWVTRGAETGSRPTEGVSHGHCKCTHPWTQQLQFWKRVLPVNLPRYTVTDGQGYSLPHCKDRRKTGNKLQIQKRGLATSVTAQPSRGI